MNFSRSTVILHLPSCESCQTKPLGGGAIGDHTNECGVSLEYRQSLRRHGSFRRACRCRGKPDASRPTSIAAFLQAGRSGIHALHGTRPCCQRRWRAERAPIPPGVAGKADRPDCSTQPFACSPVADHTLARLPRAASSRFSTPAVLVRESNPRQPDSRSGALSAELTWLTRPSVRTHERNTRRQPPR